MRSLFSTGLLLGLLTLGAQGAVTQIGGEHADNDDLASVQAILTAHFGAPVDLQLYDKSDSAPDLTTITGIPGKSGKWDVNDDTVFITYLTVKGGNGFTLYHYSPSANSGDWSTVGLTVGRNGNQPDVSHLSFWTGTQPEGGDDPLVPEPMTMGLLGSGLAAMAVARKFRN
ncbi:MAG TPA: PEP-CTERM sorting domain-containing protein [Bryobacteraceae bacterium]|nr:PEP-CTERM sorting domain-containing protein [Bryobacteraceae bacterium]